MKKLSILLALLLAVTLTACKKDAETDGEGGDASPSVQEVYEDEWGLPDDIEGFEKRVGPGSVTYSSAQGSTVMVQSPPVDEQTRQALNDQDIDAEILQMELDAILGSLSEEEVQAGFETFGHGGTVLSASVALGDDTIRYIKLVGADDNLYDIMATDRSGDTQAVIEQIVLQLKDIAA